MTKYIYYKVIQTNSGYGWDDDDFHEAYSDFIPKDYKAFKENLKSYRENFNGGIRTINRRELRNDGSYTDMRMNEAENHGMADRYY